MILIICVLKGKMWFFDWFETQFGNIEDNFDSIANAVDDVPVIGDYLAYPFRCMATFFRNLETASGSASDWTDEIIQDVSDLTSNTLTWISELWDETDLLWARIGAIPVLTIDVIRGWVIPWINTAKESMESALNAAVDVINTSIDTISDNLSIVNDWIENAADFVNDSIDNSKDKVIGWIEDSFIMLVEKVMEHEKED